VLWFYFRMHNLQVYPPFSRTKACLELQRSFESKPKPNFGYCKSDSYSPKILYIHATGSLPDFFLMA
jgi:hypothetical protein